MSTKLALASAPLDLLLVLSFSKMKHDFKKMEDEMDKLRENMSTITEFSEKITGTLQGKRQQITKLSGVHTLLKKVIIIVIVAG